MKAKILKIGETCNNSCSFCFERGKKYETNTEKIKLALREARADCCQVIFTGMEPTILPDIAGIVSLAKELEYKVIQIVSNGRMFAYRKFAHEMIFAGMTELLVPIHSHRATTHDKITGVKKSLAQTVKGISNVKEISETASPFNNVSVTVGTVVCADNIRDLPHIVPFVTRYGVDSLFFINMKPANGAAPPPDEMVRTLLLPAVSQARKSGLIAFTLGFPPDEWPEITEYSYERFLAENNVIEPAAPFDTTESYSLK